MHFLSVTDLMQTEYYFHNKIMPHTKLTDWKQKEQCFEINTDPQCFFLQLVSGICAWIWESFNKTKKNTFHMKFYI